MKTLKNINPNAVYTILIYGVALTLIPVFLKMASIAL